MRKLYFFINKIKTKNNSKNDMKQSTNEKLQNYQLC